MTFKELKNKIKKELKETASSIRILKAARKPNVYYSNPALYDKIGNLDELRYDVRHKHIAYCMFFNRTEYGDIESKCRKDNKPSTSLLDGYKKQWSYIVEASDEKTIRVS